MARDEAADIARFPLCRFTGLNIDRKILYVPGNLPESLSPDCTVESKAASSPLASILAEMTLSDCQQVPASAHSRYSQISTTCAVKR